MDVQTTAALLSVLRAGGCAEEAAIELQELLAVYRIEGLGEDDLAACIFRYARIYAEEFHDVGWAEAREARAELLRRRLREVAKFQTGGANTSQGGSQATPPL